MMNMKVAKTNGNEEWAEKSTSSSAQCEVHQLDNSFRLEPLQFVISNPIIRLRHLIRFIMMDMEETKTDRKEEWAEKSTWSSARCYILTEIYKYLNRNQ
ncbi:hypothetical protein J6590_080071 [Homalodisca vitripennis]|nr:hypothetical protein J6590_080071 [Homalodisca vitripennis]